MIKDKIIRLIQEGYKNSDIAQKLGCTDRYVRKVRAKLGKEEFEEHIANRGIKKDKIARYWDKTKKYSIEVRPNKEKPLTIEDLQELYLEKFKNHVPNYSDFPKVENKDEMLLVLDVADAHFGKLASIYETGNEYNLEIAKETVLKGVSGVLEKAKGFGIDRVLFVIGNDVLHIDNPFSKTTAGTPQSTDGMFYDMFNVAFDVYVEIIEKLASKYFVDVVFNPSNHDFMLGWTFAQKLQAWFRNVDQITFNCDMSHRKYYQFGLNMIETDHGDGCKLEQTPLLMAQEQPKMWADTIYRYSYKHHLHHKQAYKWLSGKDFVGVTIEYLRSPSATDSWHHRNGYTGAKRAIEGFIHSKSEGQIGRITHHVT